LSDLPVVSDLTTAGDAAWVSAEVAH
jgi:hypothetical protein